METKNHDRSTLSGVSYLETATQYKSYATVTSTEFPKDNQAVVIDSIDGHTLDDYIIEIIKLTKKENVKAISRISNNRICVYFANKKMVDDLIDSKKTVTLGTKVLSFRPLISRAKRIILSNVRPSIPHETLENALNEIHVKTESKVTYVRAGVSIPGCAHIVSFRRQIYVHPDSIEKLPESFQVNYEGNTFRIFVTTDTMTCFICKESGHQAKQCPRNTNYTQSEEEHNVIYSNTQTQIPTKSKQSQFDQLNYSMFTPQTDQDSNDKLQVSNHNTQEMKTLQETNSESNTQYINETNEQITLKNNILKENEAQFAGFKRVRSDISSSSNSQSNDENTAQSNGIKANKKQSTKKGKINTQENPDSEAEVAKAHLNADKDDMDKKLVNIKNYLEEGNTLLDYKQFKSLLENIKGNKRPINIILQYTDSLEDFTKFITEEIYPNVRNRSIKHRCTNLLKIIKNPQDKNLTEETPDNSDFE